MNAPLQHLPLEARLNRPLTPSLERQRLRLSVLLMLLDAPAIVVTVADTGSGMDAETLARLFDRFQRGAGSRGSGLGLAIAKGIVVAHGGEISVSSTPGRGTRVTFTLPVLPTERPFRSGNT